FSFKQYINPAIVRSFVHSLHHHHQIYRPLVKRSKAKIICFSGLIIFIQVMDQSNSSNPRVFMDLSIFDTPPQRLEIELFSQIVPKTAKNFRALCTGEAGIGQTTGKPLHYKGSFFHSFYHSFGAEGGDFENNNGTGGESIYGGTFEPELYRGSRSGPGVLMTVSQRHTNVIGSLFFLCYDHSPFLDGCSNVAFGKVVKGMETVIQLGKMGFARVQITDCGEVSVKPRSNSG
ncbi:hypothetical protein M8C21_021397, partial [Ambrosia artemisiifolia]